MAKASLARQRAFNPRDTFDDVHDLARVNPERLAKSVTTLARRKNASDGELDSAERTTVELVGTIGALAATGLVGHWDGKVEALRDAMLAEWTAAGNAASEDCPKPWDLEGVKDPGTAFWIVPKLLLPPVVAGLVAIAASSGRKPRNGRMPMPGVIETLATRTAQFTFGYAVGSWARSYGYCARAKQINSGDFTVDIAPKVAA